MRTVDIDTGETWGLELLAADRTGRRIGGDERLAVVRAALAAGIDSAQRCHATHGTREPLDLAGRFGVEVVWSGGEPVLGSIVRIAEYRPRPATIFLFTRSIRAILAAHRARPVADIYVAHELFHHLEATLLQPASGLARVTLARVGPWRWQSGVRALSEIAAHAFAQGLLELPFFPGILDRLAPGARPGPGLPARCGPCQEICLL